MNLELQVCLPSQNQSGSTWICPSGEKTKWWASFCHFFFWRGGTVQQAQPSLRPNVDGVLVNIAKWNYNIATDLLQSFYPIPLAHSLWSTAGLLPYSKALECIFVLLWTCQTLKIVGGIDILRTRGSHSRESCSKKLLMTCTAVVPHQRNPTSLVPCSCCSV